MGSSPSVNCSFIKWTWAFLHNSGALFSCFPLMKPLLTSSCWVLPESSIHSVQSLSHVRLFVTPWTAACQASLSITNSRSSPKPLSIESMMPSNHLILCHPLLLLLSIFPSIRVFSNESALRIRWSKYWSFSFNISPTNEHPGLISFRMDWLDLLAVQGTLKSLLYTLTSAFSLFNLLTYNCGIKPAIPCILFFFFLFL